MGQLKSLPNLIYTDGNSFSLWRDGKLERRSSNSTGDIETSGAKLDAPATLLPLISDFLRWAAHSTQDRQTTRQVSARLCRLLRDEVVEQMALGNPGLPALRRTGASFFSRKRMMHNSRTATRRPSPSVCWLRGRAIFPDTRNRKAAQELRKSNSLIGTALRMLTEDPSKEALKTSLGTLTRVLDAVNWHTISKDKPEAGSISTKTS